MLSITAIISIDKFVPENRRRIATNWSQRFKALAAGMFDSALNHDQSTISISTNAKTLFYQFKSQF